VVSCGVDVERMMSQLGVEPSDEGDHDHDHDHKRRRRRRQTQQSEQTSAVDSTVFALLRLLHIPSAVY